MSKPKFIKEIEKSEWKERAKCWRWYIRVYWELDHKPMVELESLEMVVKELHKLEKENKKLKEENEELKDAMKELNNYNKFIIQENERQKSKTITVTDEDNRIILEKGEDGRRHSYWGGNIVLC